MPSVRARLLRQEARDEKVISPLAETTEYMKLKDRNGVLLPAKMKYRSWIVLGPPGAGKTHLVDKIRGWPEEICIDVSTKRWWTVEPLTHRPREIHLSLPFRGFDEGLCVYDEKWKETKELPELNLDRIRIPNKKKFVLAPNWRARFVFDFVLPPPAWILQKRRGRLDSDDVRLVDMGITPEWVEWQIHTHWKIAWHFHQSGLQVMVRPFSSARPFSFPDLEKNVRIEMRPAEEEVSASADWSQARHVKRWIDEVSPMEWRASVHGKDRVEEAQEKDVPADEHPLLSPALQAGLTSPSLLDYGQVLFDGLSKWIGQESRDRTKVPLKKAS